MSAAASSLPKALPTANNVVRWFEPDSELANALVLSGSTARAVDVIARELRQTQRIIDAGIDPSTRLLFSGPSGTGKTLAARWLGWHLKRPVGIVDVAACVASHLGQTAGNIAAAFKAAAAAGGILFLDEIDAICQRRSGGGDACDAELQRATTTFFQQIDWLPPSSIVIAATNFRDELDPALRRRLTTDVAFEMPDREARRRMLERWLSRSTLGHLDLDALADETDGLSGADLRSKAMARARAHLLATTPDDDAPTKRRVRSTEAAQTLLRVLEEVKTP